jgi:hypothetical protein
MAQILDASQSNLNGEVAQGEIKGCCIRLGNTCNTVLIFWELVRVS